MRSVIRLKKIIAARGKTLASVAAMLDIDRTTLYRKLKGGIGELKINEAMRIAALLKMSEREFMRVFFGRRT